jgi:hypothetical protein
VKLIFKTDIQNYEMYSDEGSIIIGRSQKCDFVVPVESLSRKHCKIEFENGLFYVTDLDSSNGVYINGNRLPSNIRTEYSPFLPLSIGPFECQVIEENKTFTKFILPKESKSANLRPHPEAIKKFAREKVLNNLPKKNSSQRIFIGFGIVAITIIGLIISNRSKTNRVDKAEVIREKSIQEQPQPDLKKIRYDDFGSVEFYLERASKKTCKDQLFLCKNLELDERKGEGVVIDRDKREIFIFVQPEKFQNKNANIIPLLALEKLVLSHAYYGSLRDKKGQMHLIFLNEKGNPRKVYRTQFSYYNQSFDRNYALESIKHAITSDKPEIFWKEHKAYFPSVSWE